MRPLSAVSRRHHWYLRRVIVWPSFAFSFFVFFCLLWTKQARQVGLQVAFQGSLIEFLNLLFGENNSSSFSKTNNKKKKLTTEREIRILPREILHPS